MPERNARAPEDVVVVVPGGEKNPEYRGLMWRCAGCLEIHHVQVRGPKQGASWGWNGSTSKPTLTPSILKAIEGNNPIRCHSFVSDGVVRFLGDCGHNLAGQRVAMIPANADPFEREIPADQTPS